MQRVRFNLLAILWLSSKSNRFWAVRVVYACLAKSQFLHSTAPKRRESKGCQFPLMEAGRGIIDDDLPNALNAGARSILVLVNQSVQSIQLLTPHSFRHKPHSDQLTLCAPKEAGRRVRLQRSLTADQPQTRALCISSALPRIIYWVKDNLHNCCHCKITKQGVERGCV